MSVHMTKAKFLLLEVSTTTLSPSIWHHDVSTHNWGNVSIAGALYYYIESKYLTRSQYTSLRPLLLHWVPVSDAMMSLHVIEAKFLLLEVCTTKLSPSIWLWSQYISLRPRFYCERSTSTLSLSTWHHDVSTNDWGKVSTARVILHWVPVSDKWSQYTSTSLRPRFYC